MADLVPGILFAQAAPSGPSFVEGLLPFVALAAIFYFLIYRPQSQKQKAHETMVQALKRDDKVVLGNGLHGRIAEVSEDTIVLDVGGKTKLTFDKTAVARFQGDKSAEAAK